MFYVALGVLCTALVVAGFWPYFAPLFVGAVLERPWVIHVHAAIFSGWLVLLMTQMALVSLRKPRIHRQLGKFGIAYGILIFVVGLVVSFAAPLFHVAAGEWAIERAAGFLILPLGDMVLFGGFFAAAIAYRSVPVVHKRLIVLATVALIFPAAARLMNLPEILAAGNPAGMLIFLSVWLSPLLVAMVYDLVTRRTIHAVYGLGTAILVLGFGRVLIMNSEGWLYVGRMALTAFM